MILRSIFSYDEYSINEGHEDQISSELVREIFDKVLKFRETDTYKTIFVRDLDEPLPFEIRVKLKKTDEYDIPSDSEFKNLAWEEFNMKKHGFIINANTFIKGDAHDESLIEVVILLDSKSKKYQKELYYKLHDIISHEIHHVTQFDSEEEIEELGKNPHVHKRREAAQDDYQYFLLDDEIPAMIKGMNRRSQIEGKPLDQIFKEYFDPFLKHGFMTDEQYNEVMKTYIEYAVKHKTNALLSKNAKSYINKK